MLIKRAHKVELKPNKAQRIYFAKACGIARFTYNYALDLHDKHYKETGKHLSAIDTCKQLCAEKKAKYPWMYEVTKCAPQIATFNVEAAFIRFFKKQGGYPKFKKRVSQKIHLDWTTTHLMRVRSKATMLLFLILDRS